MNIYIVLLPIIIGGVLNMVFVKIPFLNSWKTPIDNHKVMKDGYRFLGDNKTWKGFFGMIFLTAIAFIICRGILGNRLDYFVSWVENNTIDGLINGGLLGLAYVLFELPNSYVKRRINIEPGKSAKGPWKFFFMIIDQADSVIGCAIVLYFISNLTVNHLLFLVALGTLVHYVINILLFYAKLKKQAS